MFAEQTPQPRLGRNRVVEHRAPETPTSSAEQRLIARMVQLGMQDEAQNKKVLTDSLVNLREIAGPTASLADIAQGKINLQEIKADLANQRAKLEEKKADYASYAEEKRALLQDDPEADIEKYDNELQRMEALIAKLGKKTNPKTTAAVDFFLLLTQK